jgi:hypothetical protein
VFAMVFAYTEYVEYSKQKGFMSISIIRDGEVLFRVVVNDASSAQRLCCSICADGYLMESGEFVEV